RITCTVVQRRPVGGILLPEEETISDTLGRYISSAFFLSGTFCVGVGRALKKIEESRQGGESVPAARSIVGYNLMVMQSGPHPGAYRSIRIPYGFVVRIVFKDIEKAFL